MEAAGTVPAGDSAPDGTRTRLLREPLFWAAVAALAGAGIGLFGTAWEATLRDDYYFDPLVRLLALVPTFVGEAFAMSSALGVAFLLWNVLPSTGRRVAGCGMALLAALLLTEAAGIASAAYWSTQERWLGGAMLPLSGLKEAAFYGIVFLPPVALSPFAALALAGREWMFGALLSGLTFLSIPFWMLRFWLLQSGPGMYSEPPLGVLHLLVGWYSVGVSLLEAPLWVFLGVMLLHRARSRALGEAFRVRERENIQAARRLYEEGLGRGEASVVDDLVSEDFRDLKRGSRGKPGMERVFSALWRSYPDLSVSIEEQEAEDDLVRTRLTLSGTDRGGVMWYPPTERRITFTADFVDRFSNGELVEHSGQADTENLLRQLGLAEPQAPPLPQTDP